MFVTPPQSPRDKLVKYKDCYMNILLETNKLVTRSHNIRQEIKIREQVLKLSNLELKSKN